MTTLVEFRELIARVRGGDAAAAEQLVSDYEPFIRRAARNRIRHSALRRVVESGDICQMVLKSLFVRAAKGQYQLDDPGQLERLLVVMVRNKVCDAWRDHADTLMSVELPPQDVLAATASENSTGWMAEVVQQLSAALSPEERDLFEARRAGESWETIGMRFGLSPDAARKRLTRALERATDLLQSWN